MALAGVLAGAMGTGAVSASVPTSGAERAPAVGGPARDGAGTAAVDRPTATVTLIRRLGGAAARWRAG
ncbi:hypothetical protein GCM10027075_35080 [Streptomyces heilongjiangensis]